MQNINPSAERQLWGLGCDCRTVHFYLLAHNEIKKCTSACRNCFPPNQVSIPLSLILGSRGCQMKEDENEHLPNDSSVLDTLHVIQSPEKLPDIGIIVLILQLRKPSSERELIRNHSRQTRAGSWSDISVQFQILHTQLCFCFRFCSYV